MTKNGISAHFQHGGELAYRADIDGLRALAVLSVVIFHVSSNLLPGGFVGVDVFFVITGYLITLIILKQISLSTFSIKIFYVRRVTRIFPALILILFVCWVLGLLLLLSEEFQQLGKHIYSGAFFLSNFTIWREAGYFDISGELKPLLHLWSLSIEEQFYIFWPPLLAIASKKNFNLLLIILSLIGLSFSLNLVFVSTQSVATFFLLHTRCWEFLSGGLLAVLVFKNTPHLSLITKNRDFFSCLGLLLIILPAAYLNGSMLFPGWLALVPVLGTLLILASGPEAIINKKLLSLKLMVWIGLISYPLYLWHWPLLSFAQIINSGESQIQTRLILILISIVLSWLTYKYLERPLRFGSPRVKQGKYASVLIIVLLMLGIVGILSKYQTSWKLMNTSEKEFLFKEPEFTNPLCLSNYRILDNAYCNQSRNFPEVAIIGDSSGHAFFPAAENYYNKLGKGVIQFGIGACLPFKDFDSRNQGQKASCYEIVENGFSNILKTSSIKTVIIIGRWHGFMGEYDRRKIEDKTFKGIISRTDLLKRGLKRTIEFLFSHKKNVIFVHAIPDMDFDPRSCIKTRYFQTSPIRETCSIEKVKIEREQSPYRKAFEEVLIHYPRVKVFDPMLYLCSSTLCKASNGDDILYRDWAHLNENGALFLSKQLDLMQIDSYE